MKAGYCSIIVKRVTKKHIGQWTCAGRLAGRAQESWDDFGVHVFDNEQPSSAAMIGTVVGAIVILIAFGGVVLISYWRKYTVYRDRINIADGPDTISESAAIPMGKVMQAGREGD